MMSKERIAPANVTSPASTGQAGGAFEQHVDALFLSLLLVHGVPPILKDAVVEEVHLQTAHAGWLTDDILVHGRSGDGQISKLALQVKRSLTISSTDSECVKTFSGFWMDFHDASRFNKERDRLSVVVLHGTQILMQNFVPLLDCARASRDAADFQGRGYLSKKAQTNCDSIRAICAAANGSPVTDQDLWEFLKSLHILVYDLATSTAQAEALIITMLSATAVGHDKRSASAATWHHLVKLAVESMGVAKSFCRDDLPKDLLSAHTPVNSAQHEALSTLTAHGKTVLRGIKDSIAKEVSLDRKKIETQVTSALAQNRVVIVSGPAGVGKSVVAKRVVERHSQEQFVFAFRAEEFATAHFDTTLRNAGVSIPAEELMGLLAAQGRKLILVESVERLLEHATREAFKDFLELLEDNALSLILTCRSYSLEIVRTSLIAPLRFPCEVVVVPELEDSELDEVAERIAALKRPLGSPALRRLFRNAFLFDKAAMMDWPEGGTLPGDERSFRKKFWSEVVRKDSETAGGLPQRRGRALQEIALRRARALTPYAACGDLDSAVVDILRRDDMVVHPEETKSLASTAHDVLEDWALIGWIDEQFYASQGDCDRFLSALDACPAIRRAYRRWLQEMLECEPADSDPFIEHVLRSQSVSPQLRDDTCVSTLISTSAPEFLSRNEELLLASDSEILIRMIHLLRIACVKIPSWIKDSAQSSFFVPSGRSWQAMLQVVQKHIDKLLPESRLLVLGLIDDFGKGVAWWDPYPKGSIEAADIAHKLLPFFEDYDSEEQNKTTLELIAKIPLAAPKKFLELVQLAKGTREERRSSEEFVEIVLEGTTSLPAARDFPDEIIELAEARMLLSESELRTSRQFSDALGVDTSFGISHRLHSDFLPASAYRGIFLPLLRNQTEKGVAFLLRLFNHVADWYTNPRYQNTLEPAYEVELTLADGSKVQQWCNGRFWRLYRGTSVGPYVLQSALMALEQYILEIAEGESESFEPLLDSLLRGSRNASISAVVASAAIAHSRLAGLTGASLLSCQEFVILDKERVIAEHDAVVIGGLLGRSDHLVYDDERRAANAMPHRKSELEIMAINLQLGGFAERVQEIIDDHKKALPDLSEQTTVDRQWRLALHRMDLRGLAAREITIEGQGESGEPSKTAFALEPQGIEEDIQEMIDEGAPAHQRFNEEVELFNWAFGKSRRQIMEEPGDNTWEKRLCQAKVYVENKLEADVESPLTFIAPRYAAAAVVRDHWDALSPEDRNWCMNLLVEALERGADDSGDYVLLSKNMMDPSRAAAFCMPLLLGKKLSPELSAVAMKGLAIALTHSNKEVIACAAEGIGHHLWTDDRDLAMFLTAAMARRANEIDRLLREDRKIQFIGRSGYFPIVLEINGLIRKLIEERGDISEDEIANLNIRGEQTRFDIDVLLSLLRNPGDDPIPRQIFKKAIVALIHWWKLDRRTRRQTDRVPHEQLSTIIERTARYALQLTTEEALKLCEPILSSVDDNYQEVAKFVQYLNTSEDQMRTGEKFWALWQEFANRLKDAEWLVHLDSDYPGYDSLISAIFFGPPSSRKRFHWLPLDGHAQTVDELALALPAHHRVLNEYVLFLYYLGEKSLPNAFISIAAIVERGDPKALLSQSNTVFCLDRMLQQYVYGSPRMLKQNAPLREAVLKLLDALVESGSSAAYRMRDDFVTPLAG
ncbi:MAG: hypothetical protein WD851_02145 [Pirellulales bacterium]